MESAGSLELEEDSGRGVPRANAGVTGPGEARLGRRDDVGGMKCCPEDPRLKEVGGESHSWAPHKGAERG